MSRLRMELRRVLILVAGCLLLPAMRTVGATDTHAVKVTIDVHTTSDPVTQYEYGMFIEPIGGLVARTLWAERLADRRFYYAVVASSKYLPDPIRIAGRT